MPNDVPDWTGLNQINIVGALSGKPLGDTGASLPAPDSVAFTVAANPGPVNSAVAVLLSLKPAAGSTIALRGVAGAATVGTSQSVTPAYGQAPAAGNCLACLVSHGGTGPTTTTPGWTKQADSGATGVGEASIFIKPNSAGNDVAPTITCTNPGGTPMVALLIELTGVATASPQENTGSATSAAAAVSATATAADAAFGDAIVAVGRWNLAASGTVSFTEVFNNSAPATHLGGLETDSVSPRAHDFALGIIPASTVPLPVGTAQWDYDASGSSQPATGSAASVVLAATPGKAYRCHMATATMTQTATTALLTGLQVLDSAAILYEEKMSLPAAAGLPCRAGQVGLALRGTVGNSMTVKVLNGGTGISQDCNVGAYLR